MSVLPYPTLYPTDTSKHHKSCLSTLNLSEQKFIYKLEIFSRIRYSEFNIISSRYGMRVLILNIRSKLFVSIVTFCICSVWILFWVEIFRFIFGNKNRFFMRERGRAIYRIIERNATKSYIIVFYRNRIIIVIK